MPSARMVRGCCQREAARGVAVASREHGQGCERGAGQGRAGTRSLQHNVATFLLKFFLARAKDVVGLNKSQQILELCCEGVILSYI